MRTLFQKFLGLGRTRSFDAAGGGRRWEAAHTVPVGIAVAAAGNGPVTVRVRLDGVATAAV